MELYLAQFATIVVVHLLAVISPGPDFVVVTKNSIAGSRSIGVWTAVGVALGIAVHVTYCLLGIALIISKSILIFSIIKWIGALYLIFIGYKALRSKPHQESIAPEEITTVSLSPFAAIKSGFLVNVLNPKATLFFLALFTQAIDPHTPKAIQLAYGIEMMTMTFIWFTVVALLFSNPFLKNKIRRVQHWIDRTTGVVLIALGIKVALSRHNS